MDRRSFIVSTSGMLLGGAFACGQEIVPRQNPQDHTSYLTACWSPENRWEGAEEVDFGYILAEVAEGNSPFTVRLVVARFGRFGRPSGEELTKIYRPIVLSAAKEVYRPVPRARGIFRAAAHKVVFRIENESLLQDIRSSFFGALEVYRCYHTHLPRTIQVTVLDGCGVEILTQTFELLGDGEVFKRGLLR